MFRPYTLSLVLTWIRWNELLITAAPALNLFLRAGILVAAGEELIVRFAGEKTFWNKLNTASLEKVFGCCGRHVVIG